jgi:sec-independent protein translocase protein TatA
MSPSIWQILIIAALAILFFGRGRISEMMGDLGRGITSFKKGLREDEKADEPRRLSAERTIDNPPAPPAEAPPAGRGSASEADRH